SPDYYFDSDNLPPLENTVIAVTGYVLYSIAICVGIPLNFYVLIRMSKLASKSADDYCNGVGVCLFVMAVSDLISLFSISIHFVLSMQSPHTLAAIAEPVLNYVCKIAIYSMHVSTSLSIWSWLLMSMLRYLSVYRPLVYIRLWKMPAKALIISFLVSSSANAWLLLCVKNNDNSSNGGGCTQVALFE
ncbi:hypothetical protein PFISCL1PPCAC_14058, partial [Pristionchus fissidentatus]